MRSLVTSIFLYACESWTLTAELQRRIQAMEMRCYLKVVRTSYKDHVINEEVRAKIQQAILPHEDPLTIVKRRKLKWYGYISLSSVWPKPSCKASVILLSRNMMKRMGESRHPCRTPTVVQSQSPMLLLKRTALVVLS